MGEDGIFVDIPDKHIPLLLDELRNELPDSVHVLSFLRVMLKWKETDKDIDFKILALNGDLCTKMILFYWLSSDKLDLRGSMHKWTHRDDDTSTFTEALRKSQHVPWHTKRVDLTGLSFETTRAVVPLFDELWKGQQFDVLWHEIFWLPIKEALKLNVEIPEGTELLPLNSTYVEEILNHWPQTSDTECGRRSDRLRFELEIEHNVAFGLFDSKTGEMLSWCVQVCYGGLGALQTKEEHRRKGYARTVLLAVAQESARRGIDPHGLIESTNTPSNSLCRKSFWLASQTTVIEKWD